MARSQDENEELATLISTAVLKEGGQLKAKYLIQDLEERYRVSIPNVQYLLKFIQKFPQNFVINKTSPRKHVVRVITNIEICSEYTKKEGSCYRDQGECGGLHICKFFLLSGNCNFGSKCLFCHDHASRHNFSVFMSHFIDPQNVAPDEIRDLLCQMECRNVTTMPNTCKFYNTAITCSNDECKNLHMCRHFLERTCKFNNRCRRNHSVLEFSVKRILTEYGFDMTRDPNDILEELVHFFQNKFMPCQSESLFEKSRQRSASVDRTQVRPSQRSLEQSSMIHDERNAYGFEAGLQCRPQIRQPKARPKSAAFMQAYSQKQTSTTDQLFAPQSTSTEPSSTICIHHLRGKCFFGNNCRNHHKSKIFQWQWLNCSHSDWKDFTEEDNLKLEKSFCQVNEKECRIKIGVNLVTVLFESMSARGGNFDYVQRLSTISGINSPTCIQKWTTIWRWYWMDDQGKWIEYSDQDTDAIEEKYVENPAGSMKWRHGRHERVLSFTTMQQTNMKTLKNRAMRRRPNSFPSTDIAKRQMAGVSLNVPKCVVPKEWKMSGNDLFQHYQVSVVAKSSQEFKKIAVLFHKTMPLNRPIRLLERIENGELWNSFCMRKEQMERKLGKDGVERVLFHGTSKDNIEAICHQGFDFRFNGKAVGTLHGKGSYFATDAIYSDRYTHDSKKMFLVQALVGDFTKGNKECVRPPPKLDSEPHGDLFDSCVDNVLDPKIFVIFDLYQVYPQYLITYQ